MPNPFWVPLGGNQEIFTSEFGIRPGTGIIAGLIDEGEPSPWSIRSSAPPAASPTTAGPSVSPAPRRSPEGQSSADDAGVGVVCSSGITDSSGRPSAFQAVTWPSRKRTSPAPDSHSPTRARPARGPCAQ